MESIYYVVTWLCHRTCEHCYEDRFRPYYGADLDGVVAQSQANFRRVIANLPERMTYLDRADGLRDAHGNQEKTGSVILAGGEVLLDAVRESVLYPALELLREKYAVHGGVKMIVQTTGDLVTPKIVRELLDRGVWMISVSGIDAYHAGLEKPEAQEALKRKLSHMFRDAGMDHLPLVAENSRSASDDGHYFHFFGATPDLWIGRLWPRGRAWRNGLTTASLADNFCNQWSGGVNFLNSAHKGSEVAIDPGGNVFPCCLKTKKAIGNLLTEPLEAILARHRRNPVYEAINAGTPQLMGLEYGWTEETFLQKSTTTMPDGTPYQNLCIGCDAFHDEVLVPQLVSISPRN